MPKELKMSGELPSARRESKMGTISKEDELSPRKNNDIVESSPKKSEPSKEEDKKEEPVIEEEKKEEPSRGGEKS